MTPPPRLTPPHQVVFDPTPEIFATDSGGSFAFPLLADGAASIETAPYDEARFLLSLWHPASGRAIDPDRAYVELQGAFDSDEEHWARLAEIEPVVPPYESGAKFDGWIVLPIFSTRSRYQIVGSGFQPRARLQIRVSAYLVA
jgi:hypothetical protein